MLGLALQSLSSGQWLPWVTPGLAPLNRVAPGLAPLSASSLAVGYSSALLEQHLQAGQHSPVNERVLPCWRE